MTYVFHPLSQVPGSQITQIHTVLYGYSSGHGFEGVCVRMDDQINFLESGIRFER